MLVVVGTSLLTGCGTTQAQISGPVGEATVAGRDVGAGSGTLDTTDLPGTGGTTAPVAPAPPDFVTRANLVAEAVRRAGVPTVPGEPQLLSGWTLDEGFETDEQKIAWMSGHVSFGPAVDETVERTGLLALPGGASRTVDVIGVRPALDRALGGSLSRPTDCDGIAAADCRLVVSKVELAQGSVRTNQGAATVPVWRLTIVGLSHTISVVAIADGVLVAPGTSASTPLPGLPAAPDGLRAADSLKRVDGSEVEVGIGSGACEVDLRAHVVELDDMVVVGATFDPPPSDTVCPAIYLSTPAVLQLSRPLGPRPVIDIVTGRPRLLGVPPL